MSDGGYYVARTGSELDAALESWRARGRRASIARGNCDSAIRSIGRRVCSDGAAQEDITPDSLMPTWIF